MCSGRASQFIFNPLIDRHRNAKALLVYCRYENFLRAQLQASPGFLSRWQSLEAADVFVDRYLLAGLAAVNDEDVSAFLRENSQLDLEVAVREIQSQCQRHQSELMKRVHEYYSSHGLFVLKLTLSRHATFSWQFAEQLVEQANQIIKHQQHYALRADLDAHQDIKYGLTVAVDALFFSLESYFAIGWFGTSFAIVNLLTRLFAPSSMQLQQWFSKAEKQHQRQYSSVPLDNALGCLRPWLTKLHHFLRMDHLGSLQKTRLMQTLVQITINSLLNVVVGGEVNIQLTVIASTIAAFLPNLIKRTAMLCGWSESKQLDFSLQYVSFSVGKFVAKRISLCRPDVALSELHCDESILSAGLRYYTPRFLSSAYSHITSFMNYLVGTDTNESIFFARN